MFGTGLITKGIKSVATGKGQASLGLQSPHLPGAIDRIGRFLFGITGSWIAITWYTAYANTRTVPGGGPKLVLPGMKATQSGPSRPDPKALGKPAFAAGIGSSSNTAATPPNTNAGGSAMRLAIARLARAQAGRPGYTYAEVRPMPQSLNSRPWRGDCSTFCTLIYKANGAPDPNGLNYNGQGYTGTMEKNGTPVKTPNIGDLAFWHNPDHVCVVTSVSADPQVTGFGGPPTPVTNSVSQESRYHSQFLGYRNYLDTFGQLPQQTLPRLNPLQRQQLAKGK